MEKRVLFSQEEKIGKFDKTDSKIIQLLNLNSRILLKDIAKVTYKSKEGVRARIKSLEKRGIILAYPTIINFEKINVQRYLFCISFKGSITEKEDYIEKMKKHKALISLSELLNEIHLLFFVKNHNHLNKIVSDITRDKIVARFVYSRIIEYYYSPPILFGLEKDEKFKRFLFELKAKKERKVDKYAIDKIDLKILKILSENASMKISEISEKLKIQRDTVKYRMDNLVKSRVIESFHIYFNVHRLGYMTNILNVSVSDRTQMKKITYFLRNHPLTNGVVELEGVWNLYTPFYSKNIKEVIDFEKEFLHKFGNFIFDYSIAGFKEQVSVREFPEFEA